MVTAEVRLDWKVPVNDGGAVRDAVWWRHYLPHNVDRVLAERGEAVGVGEGELVAQKRWLLEHMDDDRDRARRREAFAELHRINARLCAAHPALIAEADAAVSRAEVGVMNRKLAARRDWFWGLYWQGSGCGDQGSGSGLGAGDEALGGVASDE